MENEKKPIISVICPCYNQEKYLSEAIDSVLVQTMKDWELIIVDDGSTDNSYSIMTEYAGKDKRITCFRQANGGPSKARNQGAKNAHGKYLLFLDSDDILAPTYLEQGLLQMKEMMIVRFFIQESNISVPVMMKNC